MVSTAIACPHASFPSYRPSAGSIATSDKTLVYCPEQSVRFVWRNPDCQDKRPRDETDDDETTSSLSQSSCHSCTCPYLPIFHGVICAFRASRASAKSASLPQRTSCKSCILQQVIDHLVIHGNSSEKGQCLQYYRQTWYKSLYQDDSPVSCSDNQYTLYLDPSPRKSWKNSAAPSL